MTYSSSESQHQSSVPTLDSTLRIAVKDEWTGFEVSSHTLCIHSDHQAQLNRKSRLAVIGSRFVAVP
jgi:hypothetical protein